MSTPDAPAYHRLAREPALRRSPYRPWKPALEIVMALVLFVVIQLIYALCFFALSAGSGLNLGVLEDLIFGDPATTTPLSMLYFYGALALSGLSAFIAARLAGRRPAALLSVEGRLRGRPLRVSLLWIFLPAAACMLIDALVNGVPAPLTATFWMCVVLSLALVPFQSAAEELIFRGSLVQSIGAWARSPWITYGAPLPIFVAGHLYDFAGLTSVGVFAALASLLVHRTGGLEAAIVLHTTNNLVISFAEFSGLAGLPEDNNRLLVPALAVFLQYAGAVAALVVLRDYAPAKPAPPPGWFPGPGWHSGWPQVELPPDAAHLSQGTHANNP